MVRRGRVAQVRDRIAGKTVRAGLQHNEPGPPSLDKGLKLFPGCHELAIAGPRLERQIHLGARGIAATGFPGPPGTRVQEPPVFMDIRENQIRIVVEGIENTVAMVGIDVDIGDTGYRVFLAQIFNRHAAVVEDAKTSGMRAAGMVQPGNRHEGMAGPAGHDLVHAVQRGADHGRRSHIDTLERRRVTGVEKSTALTTQPCDTIEVVRIMEKFELRAGCRRRCCSPHASREPAMVQRIMKNIMAIGPERMPVTETIGGDIFAFQHEDRMCRGPHHAPAARLMIPPDLMAGGAGRAAARLAPRAGLLVRKCGASSIMKKTLSLSKAGPFADNPRLCRSSYRKAAVAQYVFTMNAVAKVVPPKRFILRDISLSFFPGAKIGVLGLNGAGKSSLLRIMAGVDKEFDGEARPQPDIRIGYLPQEPELNTAKSVRGNVEEGLADTLALIARFNEISDRFAEPLEEDEMTRLLEEQGKLQDRIDAANGWEIERQLDIAADALRLPDWDADVATLSGGERRRVALCRLLLSEPDMLLLDEPTNHLDAESVAWLERFLERYPGTVIAVTHDRYFLDNVAGWILELDRGHGIPWEGNYTSWLEQKEARLTIEEKQEAARQKSIKAELEWVRANPKARQAKSKARLQRFQELTAQEYQQRQETKEIYIPPGPRLGDLVIEANGLRKGFGDRLLIDDLSFQVPPGAIVGIIGPNGAGKTTLFRLLAGQAEADAGEIRVGDTVELAYVDQSRQTLDGSKSVWEEISGGEDLIRVGKYETPSRAYVGRFNFKGPQQQQLIGELSGGERNRVHLAKVLRAGANVLMLDEPTNDLDVETLRALEEALLEFPGCVLVISHDRWFLDRIATHILAFEGDSQVTWFQGNYQDYEQDYRRRVGDDAASPHRIRYKALA